MNASAVVLNRFVFPSSPAPAALAAHRAPRRARARAFDSRLRVAARAPNARSRRIDRVAIAFDRESRKRCVHDRSIERFDRVRARSLALDRALDRARATPPRRRARASSTRRARRAVAPASSRRSDTSDRHRFFAKKRAIANGSIARSTTRVDVVDRSREVRRDAREPRSRFERARDRSIEVRARDRATADRRRRDGRATTTATMATTRAWEDLRKDARRTESAIERELGELSAYGARRDATRRDDARE